MQGDSELQLAKHIDQTLLKPEAQLQHIEKLVEEALRYHFFAVCINSRFVPTVKSLIGRSGSLKVVAVVGFPLGACCFSAKAHETSWCIQQGADEIDTVLPIGALKDKDHTYVIKDLTAVVKASEQRPVKVIIETHLLTQEEKTLACQLIADSGAQFVKTSTGFTGGGATLEDIRLIKSVVGDHLQIKASGGVKSAEFARSLLAAGATRLGTSSGVQLVTGHSTAGGY